MCGFVVDVTEEKKEKGKKEMWIEMMWIEMR